MTFEKMVEIMEDNFKKFGWNTWKNKESIIFNMRAKYGDSFDKDMASIIYDTIYKRESNHLDDSK
jgi:hypothetical protein